MKPKQRSQMAQAPPAIVYYLRHDTFAPVGVPGLVALFQLEKRLDDLRRWWQRLRVEILAVNPDAWGRRFDKGPS